MLFTNRLPYIKKLFYSTRKMCSDKLIWIDLELTGLDPLKDRILEVACVITSFDLKPVDNEINIVIHQSDEVLNSMKTWCIEHHTKNGLIEACRKSNITLSESESTLITYIQTHCEENANKYLAGNSVYMDLLFLKMYMPTLANILHYRLVDVTAIKILADKWYPNDVKNLVKQNNHRAACDIKESIKELEYYKKFCFK